ncbi:patatin-like phospholipase family protein [Undibacterium sp. Jales W-56]|uniref:patatin-like phospholipase family protein n=1 Tax=Undibacterium sp. Jales W-56 TaxID=2897325 RepID=UPI0021CFFD7E|nr:patatin-like phospholipase family protein [Undibacterium sp. Jales W-56]MCU6432825.1 patatin-like phospholipase family protein [Undibacterium sp. Jales W-56]
MSKQETVLILQGGGALGAYQAGVYEQLHAHDFQLDWLIGTSIGAINCALIAGNPPETRVQRLQAFWQSLSPPVQPDQAWSIFSPWLQQWGSAADAWNSWKNSSETLGTLTNGVPGFFKPRVGAGWDLNAKVPLNQNSFYDTGPLKETLKKYIDFDYLNQGHIRLSVCAVEINSGQIKTFDSSKQRIGPEHIMASGALPPGFPPVAIEGKMYWDGGIYSNTPLEVFLEDTVERDALCFMVDLWDPTEAAPQTMNAAMARYKSIQYASRSKEQLETRQRIQNLQKAIRHLTDHLSVAERKKPEVQELIKMGCEHTINVVHLIMKALPEDQYFKDIDFSSETIQKRWQAGLHDATRALKHKAWLQPLPAHAGLVIHELVQE